MSHTSLIRKSFKSLEREISALPSDQAGILHNETVLEILARYDQVISAILKDNGSPVIKSLVALQEKFTDPESNTIEIRVVDQQGKLGIRIRFIRAKAGAKSPKHQSEGMISFIPLLETRPKDKTVEPELRLKFESSHALDSFRLMILSTVEHLVLNSDIALGEVKNNGEGLYHASIAVFYAQLYLFSNDISLQELQNIDIQSLLDESLAFLQTILNDLKDHPDKMTSDEITKKAKAAVAANRTR